MKHLLINSHLDKNPSLLEKWSQIKSLHLRIGITFGYFAQITPIYIFPLAPKSLLILLRLSPHFLHKNSCFIKIFLLFILLSSPINDLNHKIKKQFPNRGKYPNEEEPRPKGSKECFFLYSNFRVRGGQ